MPVNESKPLLNTNDAGAGAGFAFTPLHPKWAALRAAMSAKSPELAAAEAAAGLRKAARKAQVLAATKAGRKAEEEVAPAGTIAHEKDTGAAVKAHPLWVLRPRFPAKGSSSQGSSQGSYSAVASKTYQLRGKAVLLQMLDERSQQVLYPLMCQLVDCVGDDALAALQIKLA